MTTTTQTNGQASKGSKRGFRGLVCPLCAAEGAIQSIDLDDLHTCRCQECNDEYTLDTVREMMAKWQSVINWLESAPAID